MSDFTNQIKEEPSVEFVLILPAHEVKQEKIICNGSVIVNRFDRVWKRGAAVFSKLFSCENCSRSFRSESFMTRHRCTNLKFTCDLCGVSNKYKAGLKKHMIKKHSERESLMCEDCGESFSSAKSLIAHRNSQRKFKCSACDNNFICRSLYKKHLASHEGSFKCNQCSYIGSTMEKLFTHKRMHNKIFSCETCLKILSSKSHLHRHQKTFQHGSFADWPKLSFECEICQKSFSSLIYLKTHTKVHSELRYQCDFCAKAFKGKIGLNNHLHGHLPKEKCQICERFFSKLYLDKHIRIQHILTPTFRCNICSKIFRHKKSLKRHITVHAISKCEFKSSKLKTTNELHTFEKTNIGVKLDEDVKHEPAEEFVLILPPQESEEAEGNEEPEEEPLNECFVNITRFNRKWKRSVKVFDTVHVCRKCNRIFSQKQYLISHSCINIKFHCDLCKFSGKVFTALRKHMTVKHLKRGRFSCKNCGEGFSDARALNIHENPKKKWKCAAGDATFKCRLLYQKHIASHEGSFKCDQCSYIGSTKDKLYNHNYKHKTVCETCEKSYSSRRDLHIHQMSRQHGSHTDKPKLSFNCEICQKSFFTPIRLKLHVQTMHGEFKYQCDYCAKYFRVRKIFSAHLKTHRAKEKCTICQKFYNKFYLKTHIKNHHESQPLSQCNICFKMFKQKCNLQNHIKYVHSKLRCKFCLGRFETVKEFKDHKKVHIGLKCFKCLDCDEIFSSLFKLNVHKKKSVRP